LFLRCLTGTLVFTALLGAFPGLHLAWIVTGITGLAALGLVGLIGYAREVEAQRRSQRAATMLRREWSDTELGFAPLAASSGYPGAWDDEFDGVEEDQEFDVPEQVAIAR
jgi:hypothetical protein